MSRLSTGIANDVTTLEDRVLTLPTGTTTLDPAQHAGRLLQISTAAAAYTINLPRASGSGDVYEFLLTVAHTSGSILINAPTAAPSNKFVGTLVQYTSNVQAVLFSSTADDIITLNNTTTGGLKAGDSIKLQDVAAAVWRVSGLVTASGAGSTPFSGA